MISAVSCVIAFLIGSIPFGIWVAKLFKVEGLRTRGSGNIGATNVSRLAGFWPAGALTLFLDLLKGALPVLLLLPSIEASWVSALDLSLPPVGPSTSWAVGLFAVLGHCYCPWLQFKGGKGVATGLGALLVLSPVAAGAGILAFLLAFSLKRTGSLASLSGLAVAAITHVVLNPIQPQIVFGALLISVVIRRHDPNLDALLGNRENTF